LLGRRARPLTLYVAACALVPAAMMFALGILKPFLFEVRYFTGAVPLLLLLVARAATGITRGTVATAAVSAALLGSFALAAADQQLNGSNPRVYDFEGALGAIEREARPGDLLLHQPSYLSDVVRYYAPGLRIAPLEQGAPAGTRRVYLLASFQDQASERAAVREGVASLRGDFELARTERYPQIRVLVFERREGRR
jgi:hypothetical protein